MALASSLYKDYGWSFKYSSTYVQVRNTTNAYHTHEVAFVSTVGTEYECVRSEQGFRRGVHIFDFANSSHSDIMSVGVCSSEWDIFRMSSSVDLQNLRPDLVWLWRPKLSNIFHNNMISPYPSNEKYKAYLDFTKSIELPQNFKIVLNMDEGTCKFYAHGVDLGIAFNNLRDCKSKIHIVTNVRDRTMAFLRYIDTDELQSFDRSYKLFNPAYEKVRTIDQENDRKEYRAEMHALCDDDCNTDDCKDDYDQLFVDGEDTDAYISDDDFTE